MLSNPPRLTLLRPSLREMLEEKLAKLAKLRPLSSVLLQKLKERFEIEMTYNSNAIEGNSLTLKETYWVIQQGITVKGKPLKDHLEAKNHKQALDYLYELVAHQSAATFSEQLIKSLHAIIIQEIDKDIAGVYRKVDVFITGADHQPPSPLDVPPLMAELVSWVRTQDKKMFIVDFAAMLHHRFVHIHPFQDGNGRTGRLLMNIFLMKYGFPIAIIQKNDRQKYYRVLREADHGKARPLIQFIGQAVLRSLNIYLDSLTPAAKKGKLISLAEASRGSPYSQAYLGKLAKEGKIDAHKSGRNWVTTRDAVETYVAEQKKKKIAS